MPITRLCPPQSTRATPDLVREFDTMPALEGDRGIDPLRMTRYRKILADGKFSSVVWASILLRPAARTYRGNGQHTSRLLAERLPDLPEFYVTVERWAVDTMAEAMEVYAYYDNGMNIRTKKDFVRTFSASIPELAGVSQRLLNVTLAALGQHRLTAVQQQAIPASGRRFLLVDNIPFVLWLADVLVNGGGKKGGPSSEYPTLTYMVRLPVVRAILASYDVDREAARRFWTLVRDDNAQDPRDPTRMVARFLAQTTVIGGASSKASGRHLATSREMYCRLVNGWNAWRRGEPTALRFYADRPDPTPV